MKILGVASDPKAALGLRAGPMGWRRQGARPGPLLGPLVQFLEGRGIAHFLSRRQHALQGSNLHDRRSGRSSPQSISWTRAKDVPTCYNINIRQDWIIIYQLASSEVLDL